MRIAIAVLFVAVLAVLAFCTSVTTPGVSQAFAGQTFASQPMSDEIPAVPPPCWRYCNGTTVKFCGSSPTGQRGCVSASGDECVYQLCSGKAEPAAAH